MDPIDNEILDALRDGPLDKGGIMARVPGYPKPRIGNHINSCMVHGLVHIVGYGKGYTRIYGLEAPDVPPTPPRHQAEVVLEILRDGPMTSHQIEERMGRMLSGSVMRRLEDGGRIVRCGLDASHGGNPAVIWRLLRWAPARTPSSPSCARGAR